MDFVVAKSLGQAKRYLSLRISQQPSEYECYEFLVRVSCLLHLDFHLYASAKVEVGEFLLCEA